MATPSRFARLGIGAVSCARAPACFQVRCMSMAQAISASPSPSVLPSGVREALQASSLRQSSQLLQEPVSSAQQALAPEPFLFRYQFREPLIEGLILRKRKRFTADVAVDGQVVVCHCPTTCLSLYQTLLDGQQVRCLLSRADPAIKRQKQRETQYSLEAISLNGSDSWIGINQSAVTRYIEHYLRVGGLTSICAEPAGLRAERMVGKRRIDFVYEERDSIEVKMPPPRHMREAALKGRVGGRPYSERMLGQVVCMTEWLQEQRAILGFSDKAYKRARQMRLNPELKDPRAIMLLAYQHQEPPMRLPKRITGAPSPLMVAMRDAIKAGLEIWQVNMELDRDGVALKSYFRRHLIRGRPQKHLSMRMGHDYMRDASCPLPSTALIDSSSSSQTLVLPQDSILADQLQLPNDSSSPVGQQGAVLREPSLVWQPDIASARHMPHLEQAALVDLAAGGSAWEESSSSESVREMIEEEELAAAAA